VPDPDNLKSPSDENFTFGEKHLFSCNSGVAFAYRAAISKSHPKKLQKGFKQKSYPSHQTTPRTRLRNRSERPSSKRKAVAGEFTMQ
jgi:hypothetical protein